MSDSIGSEWGADGTGRVQIYAFMLRTYASLGITREEMLCIIHLASYYYTQPSLSTIAEEMGYDDPASVSDLIRSLEAKGFLIITRDTAVTNHIYAGPIFEAMQNQWHKVGPF